ncbi:hypothetical protein JCM18899A_09010 [Nocardioides sp. AN3]
MTTPDPPGDPSAQPLTPILLRLIEERLVRSEAHEFDQPHIVLVSGVESATYEGPYPNAISALLAAADTEAELADDDLRVSIAPLWAPRTS